MDGTQQRLINQMQILQNFCNIRMKTLSFLLEPYDERVLHQTTLSLHNLGALLEQITTHLEQSPARTRSERAMRQRGIGAFSRKVKRQLDVTEEVLDLLEADIDALPVEPWERGIAAQMLRHLHNLLISQDQLLSDLTLNHWEISRELEDMQ